MIRFATVYNGSPRETIGTVNVRRARISENAKSSALELSLASTGVDRPLNLHSAVLEIAVDM